MMEVKKERIPDVVTFVGELEPSKRATITAKVSGLIEKIYVREGDDVKKGGVLARIEQDDYTTALQAAEAALAEATAHLEQAERDHKRFSELIEKKVIAQQRYEEVRTAYELAQARHQSAQAALRNARIQLDNTLIKAPFSGFITARFKDEGERVRGGLPGIEASLLEMEDISLVRATGFLPEIEISEVKTGLDAQVKVDALPGKTFGGKVTVVNPRIDPATRTFMVKVEIPNKEFLLKGNMFARVTIVKGYREALIIPREAVLREEGVWLYHCFIAEGEKAQRKIIKPVFTSFPYVEIEEGLTEGERVIVKGQHLLRGGEALEIMGRGDEAS
ncbi:MAG: efflux RND transporter periplasmic adaptor subunit [Deltaproteobacteria bacterium]|nr:efflux RND transporter periplasmic adaptor subunit [Deltaproteobacteria bacterium]